MSEFELQNKDALMCHMFWSKLPDLSDKIMSWPHWEEVFEPQRKHSIRKYLELKKLSRNIGYYSYSGEFMMFPTGKSCCLPLPKDHQCVQVHPISASFPIAHPTAHRSVPRSEVNCASFASAWLIATSALTPVAWLILPPEWLGWSLAERRLIPLMWDMDLKLTMGTESKRHLTLW